MLSEQLAAKAKCARIRGAGDEEPGAMATVWNKYGLIIILSLIFQRFNGGRVR